MKAHTFEKVIEKIMKGILILVIVQVFKLSKIEKDNLN